MSEQCHNPIKPPRPWQLIRNFRIALHTFHYVDARDFHGAGDRNHTLAQLYRKVRGVLQ